jgi:UDP-N-acetylmuramoyl-L-alanyl-D-glutamate--2,6-diaminopimelate ligase
MKIKKLIKALGRPKAPEGLKDFKVKGISCNSRSVGKGFIFVAVKGNRQDGNKFIDEAVANGAAVVVAEKQAAKSSVPFVLVKDARLALSDLAAEFYGRPSQDIGVIGVTGTNGKTTITYLLERLLNSAGFSAGVIGTVNYRFQGKVFPSKNTTPGPLELQSLLSRMLRGKVKYAVMEVSSHALDQRRTEGVKFNSAIFTNLTQDHLDYHKTLENYFKSKARLFQQLDRNSLAIINNDDKYAGRLKKMTKARVLTYGINKDADVKAQEIRFYLSHTEFTVLAAGKRFNFRTGLIGRHNIYNILAVAAWARGQGMDLDKIAQALKSFSFVPGRLEPVSGGRGGFFVFVDYAHTEDALKNVISALRETCENKIIVVFGCGGERDKIKRPKMGKVVTELADYAIVTSDNPRSEDPLKIIMDIKKGISKKNFCVIADRKNAIAKALSLAEDKDVVLVAGKGHETYQILNDRTVVFDDREVVRECLKSAS